MSEKVEVNIAPSNVGKTGTVIDMPVIKTEVKDGLEVSFETFVSAKKGVEVSFEVETVSGK